MPGCARASRRCAWKSEARRAPLSGLRPLSWLGGEARFGQAANRFGAPGQIVLVAAPRIDAPGQIGLQPHQDRLAGLGGPL